MPPPKLAKPVLLDVALHNFQVSVVGKKKLLATTFKIIHVNSRAR